MKKIELTKAERNAIYKKAFNIYKTERLERFSRICGMCSCVQESLIIMNYGLFSYNYYLPELEKLRPRNKRKGLFWWPLENTEIRIKNFEKIIKETE